MISAALKVLEQLGELWHVINCAETTVVSCANALQIFIPLDLDGTEDARWMSLVQG